MTARNQEVYEALKAANIPEDKAIRAAESVAAFDTRHSKVERSLTLIKWMLGFNIAVSLSAVYLLFGFG